MSKPHYKSESASRPESMRSSTRTKVAAVVADTPLDETPTEAPICPEELRTRAFLKWEAAGRPEGDGVRFWLEAEHELQGPS